MINEMNEMNEGESRREMGMSFLVTTGRMVMVIDANVAVGMIDNLAR